MNKKVKQKSLMQKCDSCGANMRYSIKKKGLFCENCLNLKKVKDENITQKKPIEIGKKLDLERKDAGNECFFKCENCGANVTLDAFEMSGVCPYCESAKIIQTEEIKGIKPDKVLRFELEENDVKQKFFEFAKKKFFVPNSFKKNFPKNVIEATYIPCFTFNAKTFTKYSGVLYKRVRDSEGHTKIVYFNVNSSIDLKFSEIVIESSSKISQIILEKILPYNFNAGVDYKPEYLLGFDVERYDNAFQRSVDNANQFMKKEIQKAVVKKHYADGVKSLTQNTQYDDYLYEYELLPLYVLQFNYKNKPYTTYVNGQTGKVGGKLPVSRIKVTFVSIFVIIGILILIFALS